MNKKLVVGLYPGMAAPDHYKYLKACGYTMLQFMETAWLYKDDKLDDYFIKFSREMKEAQDEGFQVNVILLSNMKKTDGGVNDWVFDTRNKIETDHRMLVLTQMIKACHFVDGFTFFGGDPGGEPVEMGTEGIYEWIKMAKAVHEIVKREAPKAEYNINIWATAAFNYVNLSPWSAEFWIREVEDGKLILKQPDLLGPDCGIEFPVHNYYRTLARACYVKENIPLELFPTTEVVNDLKSRGVKRIWAWPHFLVDEIDDCDTGYSEGDYGHRAQGETRYIHQIVRDMQRIGISTIISDINPPSASAEVLNMYALARCCIEPTATPDSIIDEFSAVVADENTKAILGQVLRFIENYSTWEQTIPEKYRLTSFKCDFNNAEMALMGLKKVAPRLQPSMPLPEPPAVYIKRLQARLDELVSLENK